MRSYRFTLYVWIEEKDNISLETDELKILLKTMWKYRKYQFQFTWNKPKK